MSQQRKTIKVFSTKDNPFNKNGNYKLESFALSEEGVAYVNWFVENIDIADYKKEITAYCNEQYDATEVSNYRGWPRE